MGLAKLQWQANRLGYSLALTPARGKLIVMPKFKVVRNAWNILVVNKHIKFNLHLFHVCNITLSPCIVYVYKCRKQNRTTKKQSLKCRLQINVEVYWDILLFVHFICFWRQLFGLLSSKLLKMEQRYNFFVWGLGKINTLNRGKVRKISYFVGSLSYW